MQVGHVRQSNSVVQEPSIIYTELCLAEKSTWPTGPVLVIEGHQRYSSGPSWDPEVLTVGA